MRWLIIFPVVGSSSLGAEDDRNDSLLRTLQISPISEAGGREGSQGRLHCCPSPSLYPARVLMRQSSPRAAHAPPSKSRGPRDDHPSARPTIYATGFGFFAEQRNSRTRVIESRTRRCEMLINIWPGRMEEAFPLPLSLSLPRRDRCCFILRRSSDYPGN